MTTEGPLRRLWVVAKFHWLAHEHKPWRPRPGLVVEA
jgi:hypothetical protein